MPQGEYHGKEETLLVMEGNDPKKPIASIGRCIVFMPTNAPIGKRVRVRLADTGGTDKNNRTKYRAFPADPLYRNEWKDNKNGTASQVTISTNWLGEEANEGEVETVSFQTRENPSAAYPTQETNVLWGSDRASAQVEVISLTRYPQETQKVSSGQLVWHTTSYRDEESSKVFAPVTKIGVSGTWRTNALKLVYEPDWQCSVAIEFENNGHCSLTQSMAWKDLPCWLQDELSAEHPVCSCGRSRMHAKQNDDYQKCGQCRNEEVCIRCGKQGYINNHAGRYVCTSCEQYELGEKLIHESFSLTARQNIARTAELLSSGEAFETDAGMLMLGATLNHIEDASRRTRLLDGWKGYLWYYFTPKGVFGSKFSPSALRMLTLLSQAQGNGLVELVAWLISPHKTTAQNNRDFYIAHQLMQVEVTSSSLPDFLSCNWEKMVAGERLRGAESDRFAAWELYKKLQTIHAGQPQLAEAKRLLEADEQDYAQALTTLKTAETYLAERQAKISSGAILPDFAVDYDMQGDGRGQRRFTEEFWAVLPNGDVLRPGGDTNTATFGDLNSAAVVISHGSGDTRIEEWWAVHCLPKQLTPAQIRVIGQLEAETRKYFSGNATGWKLSQVGVNRMIATYNGRSNDEYDAYTEMCNNLPVEVSRQETGEVNGTLEVYARVRSTAEDKAVDEQVDLIADLEEQMQALGGNRQEEREAYEAAEVEWQMRDDCEAGSSPIEDGTVFLVKRFVKSNFKGEERRVSEPFYDWQSDSDIQLVLDPFSHASHELPEDARDVLVRVRKKNSEQVHLFERPIRTASGSRYTKGYFVIPIPSPQDLDWRIVELEEKLAQARTKLAELRQKAKAAAQTEIKTTRKAQKWEEMSKPQPVASYSEPTNKGDVLTYSPFAEFFKNK